MILQTGFSVAAFLVAAIAGGMACVFCRRNQAGSSHRSLAAMLGATAAANLANGVGLLDESHALFWRGVVMAAELVQPAAILYIGLGFLNPAGSGKDVSALWRARAIGLSGGVLAIVAVSGLAFQWAASDNGQAVMVLTTWGRILYMFLIIGMALGLAQLELVLRASREPVRHRLKFIVIGLGGLAGYQIYQASRVLLVPVWQTDQLLVSTVVMLVALALIAYGVGRSRLREIFVSAYVSQQALFGSVTFIIIGLYLLVVGIIGEWLRQTGQPWSEGLSVIVVFAALVGLVITVFSKTVRATLQHFVVRNFYRSKYDYRAHWLQVTKAFEEVASKDGIMDRLLDLLIKTFPTTSISIWSFRDTDQQYCRVRSMTTEADPAPLELSHPVVRRLVKYDEPVWMDEWRKEKGDGAISLSDSLVASGAALCFPVRAQGRLTAFIALGAPLHGGTYGTDDCDLLGGISHHVGTLLSHACLAEERRDSAELEALHRFSVFCLHDLKNLAARLSLVAQNAVQHGRDPAFQESAMRTVGDTAKKMTALMTKLSLKSMDPVHSGVPELVDISALIEEVSAPMRGDGRVRFNMTGEPVPPVMVVRSQIQQLLLNVILNAKYALGENGEIFIEVDQSDGSVTIKVRDTGCGIPPAMMDSLFRPSQTGRPGGLGVGLYQCKQIVEAHRGTIQIRSEVGKGTEVRIELPLSPIVDHETLNVNC